MSFIVLSMDLNLLSLASSIALPKGDVNQQLDQHRQQANFRQKLDDLEAAIERQKQGVRVAVRQEPIWGVKPGSVAGGADNGGEGTDIEVEEDADTHTLLEEEPSLQSSSSSMEDDALIVGELGDDTLASDDV